MAPVAPIDQPTDQQPQSQLAQDVSKVFSNALNEVVGKTQDWAKWGVQQAKDINDKGNQLAVSNPLALSGTPMQEGITEAPAPKQTPEQQQDLQNYQNAIDTFTNETVKPAAYVAGLAALEVAAPFMAYDIGKDVANNGVVQGAKNFVNYDTLKNYYDNPDQLKQDLFNKPVTTAANLLPAALLARGAYKGGKTVIQNHSDLVNELVSNVENKLNNERGAIGESPSDVPTIPKADDLVQEVEQKLNLKQSAEQPTLTLEDRLQSNPITNGFIAQDVAPVVEGVNDTAKSIKDYLSPASVNSDTRYTADVIRDYNATKKLDYLQAEKGLEDAHSYWENKTSQEQISDAIAYQNGQLNDPVIKPITDALQEQSNKAADILQSMGKLDNFKDNYLPQIWKDTPQNKQILARLNNGNVFKTPQGFLKAKNIPDYETGINLGMTPKYTNPVDMMTHRLGQEYDYIMGESIKNELESAGEIKLVKAPTPVVGEDGNVITKDGKPVWGKGGEVPSGWRQINAQDNPLGPNAKGAYYAPPEVAQLIENFFDKGWQNEPLYKGWMKVANTFNQFQLLSFYHMGKTAWETTMSKLSLMPQLATDAVSNLAKGEYGKAAGNIVDAVTKTPGPLTPFTTWYSGRKFMDTLTDPKHANDPLVQSFKAGGGQIGLGKDFTTKYWTSLRKAWVTGNYVGSAIRAPFAAAERLSGLTLEKWVPYEKAGAFQQLMGYELKKDPSLINDRPRLRSVAAKAIDSLDNRLGQVNWDNLFLDPKFKQSLFMAMRAPGFAGGTIREIGGGAIDAAKAGMGAVGKIAQKAGIDSDITNAMAKNPVGMTHRMAYTLSLPIATIAANYVMQTLMTGQQPDLSSEKGKLLYGFKNGQTDEWGNSKYSSVPSYTGEVYRWGHSPGETATNKLHPLISLLAQIYNNRDYYGTQIRNPKDSRVDQALEAGKYALRQLTPFSVTSAIKQTGTEGKNALETAQNFANYVKNGSAKDDLQVVLPQFGVSPTPSRLTMTDAQQAAQELMRNKQQAGPRTQQQADKSQLKSKLRKDAIGQSKVPQTILDALHAGQITKKEALKIWQDRNITPLASTVKASSVSLDDAMDIWTKATDTEKAQIRPQVVDKIRNIVNNKKATSDQRQKALKYYHQYLKQK